MPAMSLTVHATHWTEKPPASQTTVESRKAQFRNRARTEAVLALESTAKQLKQANHNLKVALLALSSKTATTTLNGSTHVAAERAASSSTLEAGASAEKRRVEDAQTLVRDLRAKHKAAQAVARGKLSPTQSAALALPATSFSSSTYCPSGHLPASDFNSFPRHPPQPAAVDSRLALAAADGKLNASPQPATTTSDTRDEQSKKKKTKPASEDSPAVVFNEEDGGYAARQSRLKAEKRAEAVASVRGVDSGEADPRVAALRVKAKTWAASFESKEAARALDAEDEAKQRHRDDTWWASLPPPSLEEDERRKAAVASKLARARRDTASEAREREAAENDALGETGGRVESALAAQRDALVASNRGVAFVPGSYLQLTQQQQQQRRGQRRPAPAHAARPLKEEEEAAAERSEEGKTTTLPPTTEVSGGKGDEAVVAAALEAADSESKHESTQPVLTTPSATDTTPPVEAAVEAAEHDEKNIMSDLIAAGGTNATTSAATTAALRVLPVGECALRLVDSERRSKLKQEWVVGGYTQRSTLSTHAHYRVAGAASQPDPSLAPTPTAAAAAAAAAVAVTAVTNVAAAATDATDAAASHHHKREEREASKSLGSGERRGSHGLGFFSTPPHHLHTQQRHHHPEEQRLSSWHQRTRPTAAAAAVTPAAETPKERTQRRHEKQSTGGSGGRSTKERKLGKGRCDRRSSRTLKARVFAEGFFAKWDPNGCGVLSRSELKRAFASVGGGLGGGGGGGGSEEGGGGGGKRRAPTAAATAAATAALQDLSVVETAEPSPPRAQRALVMAAAGELFNVDAVFEALGYPPTPPSSSVSSLMTMHGGEGDHLITLGELTAYLVVSSERLRTKLRRSPASTTLEEDGGAGVEAATNAALNTVIANGVPATTTTTTTTVAAAAAATLLEGTNIRAEGFVGELSEKENKRHEVSAAATSEASSEREEEISNLQATPQHDRRRRVKTAMTLAVDVDEDKDKDDDKNNGDDSGDSSFLATPAASTTTAVPAPTTFALPLSPSPAPTPPRRDAPPLDGASHGETPANDHPSGGGSNSAPSSDEGSSRVGLRQKTVSFTGGSLLKAALDAEKGESTGGSDAAVVHAEPSSSPPPIPPPSPTGKSRTPTPSPPRSHSPSPPRSHSPSPSRSHSPSSSSSSPSGTADGFHGLVEPDSSPPPIGFGHHTSVPQAATMAAADDDDLEPSASTTPVPTPPVSEFSAFSFAVPGSDDEDEDGEEEDESTRNGGNGGEANDGRALDNSLLSPATNKQIKDDESDDDMEEFMNGL